MKRKVLFILVTSITILLCPLQAGETQANSYPSWDECVAVLHKRIDSPEARTLVKKYRLNRELRRAVKSDPNSISGHYMDPGNFLFFYVENSVITEVTWALAVKSFLISRCPVGDKGPLGLTPLLAPLAVSRLLGKPDEKISKAKKAGLQQEWTYNGKKCKLTFLDGMLMRLSSTEDKGSKK